MKTHPSLLLLACLLLPVVTASAQLIGYTNGSKVNLLNAWNASMSVTGTDAGSNETANQARFYQEKVGNPVSMRLTPASNPGATLDFGAVRTVKTLTTYGSFAGFGFTSALVETSTDGVNWTTSTNTVTNPGSTTNTVVTLNSAVSARYVRVTPIAFENGSLWLFDTVRAFGTTGALAGDTNLSIIANGGFTATQTLTPIGSVNQLSPGQIIAPATSPLGRQLIYSIGDGEGFKLDLGQTFKVDRGTLSLDGNPFNASVSNPLVLTLSGSLDDSSYSTLYTKTYTSNLTTFDLFNFSFTATDARYLKLTVSTAIDTDIRVSDFAFFQTVPEPSTYALVGVACGAFALRGRIRRRKLAA